jgi:serine/threonine protein phosphatase PrpC
MGGTTSAPRRISAGGCSETGPVRPLNQDWLHWDAALGLFIVADGRGGHKAGEVASHLAVDTVCDFVAASREADDLTWPFGVDPARSLEGNRLATAVRLANRRVYQEGQAHPEFTGMGTTLVAVLIGSYGAAVAGVGDSRVYLWRGNALSQLTHDDTWLQTVLGAEAARDAVGHPMRHVLTSVIGSREDTPPEIVEPSLDRGDVLLLSTDGLHAVVDDGHIARVLADESEPGRAAERLVADAIARKSTDNVTALVLRLD